jgi:hypothetical protein
MQLRAALRANLDDLSESDQRLLFKKLNKQFEKTKGV